MRLVRTLRLSSHTSAFPPKPQIPQRGPVTPRTISTTQRHPELQLKAKGNTYTTRREFNLSSLASLLPNGNNNGNNSLKRVLTANRTLPYKPAVLFKVISSVESYSQFLPFLTASTVTARDPETGYPTQAFLTIGYGPLSETFTSRVDCDPATGVVEARSGAKYAESASGQAAVSSKSGLSGLFPGANEGIFEYLSTRWELVTVSPENASSGPQTMVTLEVKFEFRNPLHATVMSTVEGQMAGIMIEAFEKRIQEMHGKGL
ncbi:hypothetical protein N7495_006725 [Penicillium taxi]|uniref:uncharacterized protein n=1 Tax=Penicillium taxi TaxID=168475 RepID=UPI0025459571|nr:uncharacterized protein N7495_006725 [Penicillium taxi]KAJ5895034.1 hypothetical protein N7495_006725 [Penicillium taxi]